MAGMGSPNGGQILSVDKTKKVKTVNIIHYGKYCSLNILFIGFYFLPTSAIAMTANIFKISNVALHKY